MLLTVGVFTLPTILWMYYRFFVIFQERYGIIRYHAKTEGLRMSTHILVGMLLLILFPLYLAYLCIPPPPVHNNDNNSAINGGSSSADNDNSSLFVHGWHTKIILWMIAIALVVLNLTTFFLLPHPKRFDEYRKDLSKRIYIKTLSSFHGVNLQYMAMSLSALAISLNHGHHHFQDEEKHFVLIAFYATMKFCVLGVSWIIYTSSIGISLFEINEKAWEDYDWAKTILFPSLPFGPKSKSNLIGTTGESASYIINVTHMFIVVIGSVAWVQTTCQIVQMTLPSSVLPPPSKAVETFFTPMLLYTTIIMNVGFFVLSQTSITGSLTNYLDFILGQLWPIGLTMVGSAWLQALEHPNNDEIAPFFWQHLFWTSRYY